MTWEQLQKIYRDEIKELKDIIENSEKDNYYNIRKRIESNNKDFEQIATEFCENYFGNFDKYYVLRKIEKCLQENPKEEMKEILFAVYYNIFN